MKFAPSCPHGLLLLWPLLAFGTPEFTGVTTDENRSPIFSLRDTDSESRSGWIKIGSTFSGYKLHSYDEATGTLKLVKDKESLNLQLVAAIILPAPETEKPLVELTPEELQARGFYKVAAGDTGAGIARRHELSLKVLIELNPDVNWARLKIGRFLRIRVDAPATTTEQ